jgi:hypothetical protein
VAVTGPPKIIICAPSNRALDNIIQRVLEGSILRLVPCISELDKDGNSDARASERDILTTWHQTKGSGAGFEAVNPPSPQRPISSSSSVQRVSFPKVFWISGFPSNALARSVDLHEQVRKNLEAANSHTARQEGYKKTHDSFLIEADILFMTFSGA